MDVIIVGGGVAGLTCGQQLIQHGHTVTLYEADDDVGGRVRSDYRAGYTLDRGFQVLFDAYPAAQRLLDYPALDLRSFEPSAIVCEGGRRAVVTDPLRDHDPLAVLAALSTNVVPLRDKLRILRLALTLRATSIDQLLRGGDTTTESYLYQRGFSRHTVDTFFRPFFGGIFLDRSLTTSAKNFKFNFKLLSEGNTVIPAGGMQQISHQLAQPLRSADALQTCCRVQTLLTENDRVVGVQLADGREQRAQAVVVATTAPEAARLTDLPMPQGSQQTVTLYFSSLQCLYAGRKLLLNAAPDAFVNNAQMLTNVAPEYAPPGRHLLSVSLVGMPPLDDAELAARALADLRVMFSGNTYAQQVLNTQELLAIYHIPYAQFRQPPGIHGYLPTNDSGRPGLFFAAEFTEASSINAAMISGENCAALLMEQIPATT